MLVSIVKTVFKKPSYALLAVATSFALLFIAAWMRNIKFLGFLLFSSQFGFAAKLKIFEWTFANLALNTTPLRLVLVILAAVLASVNVALLAFYLRKRVAVGREAGTSAGGLIVSALGVGCASCGSVLLTSLLGFSAGAAALAALPLQGAEFTLVGIGLISVSIVMLAKKIQNPFVCEIK
jgi:hypothetical protein